MKVLKFVSLFLIGLAVGYFLPRFFDSSRTFKATGKSQIVGRIILLDKYDNGLTRETGFDIPYDISGIYPGTSFVWISPDKNKVVYSVWENAHISLYVSALDGSKARKIADQEVPEGSGSLIVNSIRWSTDSSKIIYSEDGQKCVKLVCVNPEDFSDIRITYSVDISSGNKSIVQSH
jgi:hypothetical protein